MIGDAVRKKPKKVGLLEHFGTGNLGDDATVQSVLSNIRQRWPRASIIGLSVNPSDSEKRHGLPSYAIRRKVLSFEELWSSAAPPTTTRRVTFKARVKARLANRQFLLDLARALYNVVIAKPSQILHEIVFLMQSAFVAYQLDLLIICGGGQLLDAWGGPWSFPYTLFKWVILAKLSGAQCFFLNVGAGPLEHPLSKWFIKQALRYGDYISFRDAKSRALVEKLGISEKLPVVADNVYSLALPEACAGARESAGRHDREATHDRVVGLAPMAYCDPNRYWDKNRENYDLLIRALGAFGASLVRNGFSLRLFSSDIWFDTQAVADVENAVKTELGVVTTDRIRREPVRSVDDFLGQLSCVDYFVTCRFHGVVFSHLLNVPVLAIAHHPKITTLMEDFNLSCYCMDIAQCCEYTLTETFVRLVQSEETVKQRMRWKVRRHQKELENQFDFLFPACPSAAEVPERGGAYIAPDQRVVPYGKSNVNIGSTR